MDREVYGRRRRTTISYGSTWARRGATMAGVPSTNRRLRASLLAAVAALMLTAAGSLAGPQPVHAGTADTIEARLLTLINAARERRGIEPLRLRGSLVDLAGDRAAKMASTGVLKHPKCLSCVLDSRDISYSGYGETIAWSYPWGSEAARNLFRIWKNSPPHWAILMSPTLDRIGIGAAKRGSGSNASTWAAAVLTG
jgi:uncharacterized protein YkwD